MPRTPIAPRSEKIQICLPPDLLHELREEGKKSGNKVAGTIRAACREYLNRTPKQKKGVASNA